MLVGIMNFSNIVDDLWNRVMAVLGGPVLAFIFMRYVEATTGYTQIRTIVFFILAVLIVSPTFLEGIGCSILSFFIFTGIRKFFLAGFFGFNWWGHETAIAAAVAVGFVNLIVFFIILSRTGIQTKKT